MAWQRTTLTGMAALLVIVRLIAEYSPTLSLAIGLLAGTALLVPVWSAARWQFTNRTLADTGLNDGRAPLLLAMLVGSASLAGLGYVLVA